MLELHLLEFSCRELSRVLGEKGVIVFEDVEHAIMTSMDTFPLSKVFINSKSLFGIRGNEKKSKY